MIAVFAKEIFGQEKGIESKEWNDDTEENIEDLVEMKGFATVSSRKRARSAISLGGVQDQEDSGEAPVDILISPESSKVVPIRTMISSGTLLPPPKPPRLIGAGEPKLPRMVSFLDTEVDGEDQESRISPFNNSNSTSEF